MSTKLEKVGDYMGTKMSKTVGFLNSKAVEIKGVYDSLNLEGTQVQEEHKAKATKARVEWKAETESVEQKGIQDVSDLLSLIKNNPDDAVNSTQEALNQIDTNETVLLQQIAEAKKDILDKYSARAAAFGTEVDFSNGFNGEEEEAKGGAV